MPFPGLADRLQSVQARIASAVARGAHGQRVELIAVTKTHGPDAVEAAWACGIRSVGENKVQEALDKMAHVAAPVAWHLIGHLQRNKAKHATRFALVHSMDSARLADALHDVAQKAGTRLRVLVQVNASGEESKGGYDPSELAAEAARLRRLEALDVAGVMTMAPFDADEALLRSTFARARAARDVLREAGHAAHELSMGMSNDFEVAVEEGATMVRLGTILFGERTP
ncbi:MAG: YggS family pyridoxal phosphate-dependent enzyme [Gemmatimonadaceae bacterium]|nr:YggS family pyridoxal phosphate-dependent enzyme [Gemmatimonadaceae bacterium]